MAINVVKFTRPKLYLSLVAGGSLTVGQTYYFMGVVTYGGGYYGESNSQASEQASITPTSGNQSIKIEWFQDGGDITSFADAGSGEVTITTSASHGRSNGNTAYIRGTTNYDGSYTISNVTSNTFDITHSWDGDDGASEWFAEAGTQDEASGIIFKWDKYDMIDSSDGEPYQWLNLNDPDNSSYTEFETGNGHRRWSTQRYNTSHSGTSITFTEEETSLQTYGLMDGAALGSNRVGSATRSYLDIAWRKTDYPLDNKFARDKGKLAVFASGTGNTIDTLRTALENSGYTDMYTIGYGSSSFNNAIMILGCFFGKSGCGVEFNDSTITMIGGQFNYSSYSQGTIVCNRCTIMNNTLCYYQWANPEGEYNDTVYSHFGNALILNSVSSDSVNFAPKHNNGMTYYSTQFSNVNLIGTGFPYFQWRYQRDTPDSSMTDVYIKDLYIMLNENGSGDYTGHMTRVEFVNEGVQNYDVNDKWGYQDADNDKIMECTDVTCDRPDGKIKVYCGSVGSQTWTDTWNMRFAINLIILNEKGSAVENADIDLSWDGGSDTDTTDSNGEASVTALSYQLTHDNTKGTGYYTTSDYKNLILTISKLGYETLKLDNFTISEGKEWTITLEHSPYQVEI